MPPQTPLTKQKRNRSKVIKIAFLVAVPLTALTGVLIFATNGTDQEPLASPEVATETTTTTTEASLTVSTTSEPLVVATTTQVSPVVPSLEAGNVNWEQVARSVVQIKVPSCGGESWTGSGTIVLDGSYVLTNWHVSGGSFCEMEIHAIDSIKDLPNFISYAESIPTAFDEGLDLAVLRLVDANGMPVIATGRAPMEANQNDVDLGAVIKVLGFPSMGGGTFSMTTGEQSGWWEDFIYGLWTEEFYKTSAKMSPGISGGAAFEAETGRFIGIPTGTPNPESEGDILGLVRPSRYALPLLEAAERAN